MDLSKRRLERASRKLRQSLREAIAYRRERRPYVTFTWAAGFSMVVMLGLATWWFWKTRRDRNTTMNEEERSSSHTGDSNDITGKDSERQLGRDEEPRGVERPEAGQQSDAERESETPGRTDAERQDAAEQLIEEEGLLGIEGAVPPSEEASFLNLRTIFIAVIGLVAMIVFIHIAALVLFGFFLRTSPTGVDPAPQPTPGIVGVGQGLQVNPPEDYQRLRATQQAMIEDYAWIDRQQGRVRIPIERAMELIAEQGLPVQPDDAEIQKTEEPDESGLLPGTAVP